jgi:hypothetical protein
MGLNGDHVRFLQGLVSNGVELPPIKIAKGSMDLIDGRHRLAAYINLGHTKVACDEEVYTSKDAMILAALKANVGGSLPPNQHDISHTVECLLAEKLSRSVIIQQISEQVGFPPKLVRRYLDDIQSRVADRRKTEAVSAIASGGMTLIQAAEEYSVDVESLKAAISGKPKESTNNAMAIMTRLSVRFETFNHSIGMIMTHILRGLKDGVISEREANEIIEHYTRLVQGYQTKEKLWTQRFENLLKVNGASDKLLPKKRRTAKTPKKEKKATVAKKEVSSNGASALIKMGF